jgi:hypothetical protein
MAKKIKCKHKKCEEVAENKKVFWQTKISETRNKAFLEGSKELVC